MALKSNRVGVRTDQVDEYGRVISKSFFQSLIDHLPRWTSLKVWKNGTEQLLPVNTDEPVTSPIVAEIQYPTDSSATEQMFTYRVSPTDADGEAYIQSIKGNTIVWNQLMQDIEDASKYGGNGGTVSYSDGGILFSLTSGTSARNFGQNTNVSATAVTGHKYLYSCDLTLSKVSGYIAIAPRIGQLIYPSNYTSGVKKHIEGIFASTGDTALRFFVYPHDTGSYTVEEAETVLLQNPMIIDLTQMFGSTKADEIYAMEQSQSGSGVAYFRSLYSLPYYQYDAGSLLSFNGTGIKTTGKNLFNKAVTTNYYCDGTQTLQSNSDITSVYIELKANTTYTYKQTNTGVFSRYSLCNSIAQNAPIVRPTTKGAGYLQVSEFTFTSDNYKYLICSIHRNGQDTKTFDEIADTCQLELGSTATSYEPYITSTTTIPTDTYFPTGMKSAGTVYDEFNSSRAYTRIGEVDLGSLTWTYYNSGSTFFYTSLPASSDIKANTTNVKCALYGTAYSETRIAISGTIIRIYDSNYSDATVFKTAMNGVMLQYELAEEIIEPTLEFDEE